MLAPIKTQFTGPALFRVKLWLILVVGDVKLPVETPLTPVIAAKPVLTEVVSVLPMMFVRKLVAVQVPVQFPVK